MFSGTSCQQFLDSPRRRKPRSPHRGSFNVNSAASLVSSVRHHDPEGPAPEGPKVEWSAPVDVKAVLLGLAKSKKQKLNYDKSIVDLLKLLDLDSSLPARQELAKELGYSGDTKGSSKMNVWLHKEVMRQLAANGGKVPKTWMA